MVFRLRNGAETFQRIMDVTLAIIKWQFALIYLDEIVFFSKSPAKHIDHGKQELTSLQSAELTHKLKNWNLFLDTIDYLEHVIRPRRLKPTARTADAIQKLRKLHNLIERRSFLELYNDFRRFIPSFALIAASLFRKKQKNKPRNFGPLFEKELIAMKIFQEIVISPLTLALPYAGGHFTKPFNV